MKISRAVNTSAHPSASASIDWTLFNPGAPYSLAVFGHGMRKENVEVVIPALTQRDTRGPKPAYTEPKPDDGHGVFYIDFNSMTAVRDTDLGQCLDRQPGYRHKKA